MDGVAAPPLPRLHIITDDDVLRRPDFASTAAGLFSVGAGRIALHLRGRGTSGRALWDLAERGADLAARFGGLLVVNDRLDVAMASGAGGVQLGHRSLRIPDARRIIGADRLIGASVHSQDEAARAAGEGADFLIAGTIFSTDSHPGTPPSGVGWLGRLTELNTPVVGIGGISLGRVREVLAAGAYGVAVLGGIWRADAPIRAMSEYLAELEKEGDDG